MATNNKKGSGKKRTDDSFNGLLNHATDKKTGTIDVRKMEQQEGKYGSNGGRGCDVGIGGGPCSCGAWH
jgi:hypothetical protein